MFCLHHDFFISFLCVVGTEMVPMLPFFLSIPVKSNKYDIQVRFAGHHCEILDLASSRQCAWRILDLR